MWLVNILIYRILREPLSFFVTPLMTVYVSDTTTFHKKKECSFNEEVNYSRTRRLIESTPMTRTLIPKNNLTDGILKSRT